MVSRSAAQVCGGEEGGNGDGVRRHRWVSYHIGVESRARTGTHYAALGATTQAMARRAWGGRATGGNWAGMGRSARWAGTGEGQEHRMERAILPSFPCTTAAPAHGASPMRRCKRLQPRTPHPAPLALLKPTLDRLPSLLACPLRMGFTFVRRRLAGEEGNNATCFYSLLPFHSHSTRAPLAVCPRPFSTPSSVAPLPTLCPCTHTSTMIHIGFTTLRICGIAECL
ncbi:hypothetical protein B0H13DRAFT_1201985 [Mycena leptocephala]|nr:hypothetical protein B0H13DRAFT_1201985 [Mycena leptocephala]